MLQSKNTRSCAYRKLTITFYNLQVYQIFCRFSNHVHVLSTNRQLRPRSHGTGQIWDRRIFVQIRLAFTRDPRNRTNSSTANRTNSQPKKIRSRFLRHRSQILTNACEHRNRSFSRLICTVGNWNELDNAMKPALNPINWKCFVVYRKDRH